MTQEEKATAYDKIREKIAIRLGSNVAEEIFSEFDDSENEKIRKDLIKWFEEFPDMMWMGHCCRYSHYKKDIIAWLEKQGEQKPAWSEEDEKRVESLHGWLDTLVNYIHHDAIVSLDLRRERMQEIERLKTWFKSLKDRYTWKPSEKQIEALEHYVRGIGESEYASPYDDNTKLMYSLVSDLKKLTS